MAGMGLLLDSNGLNTVVACRLPVPRSERTTRRPLLVFQPFAADGETLLSLMGPENDDEFRQTQGRLLGKTKSSNPRRSWPSRPFLRPQSGSAHWELTPTTTPAPFPTM